MCVLLQTCLSGSGFDGRQDEGLPVAETGSSRAIRARVMDPRQPLEDSYFVVLRTDNKATEVVRE